MPPFPTDALPDCLKAFVEAEAVATQTPPDLAAMLIMAVCSAACAKTVQVNVTNDWFEPVNLYTVIALPPGNRKSAVFRDMTRPIVEFEAEQLEASIVTIAEQQNERDILEARFREAQKKAISHDPKTWVEDVAWAEDLARQVAEFKVPVPPRLLADDTSPERLATLLCEQGGRIAVMSPEGDIFDIMAGRYSAGNQANFGVFLKGHAGDDIRVDRVNRPSEQIERPAITMGLAVQPDVLHGLLQKPSMRGRGLLARFLFSVPPSPVGHREIEVPPVPRTVRERYERLIRRLLMFKPGVDANGKPEPHTLHFASDAYTRIIGLSYWLEPRLADGDELEHLRDWASKLTGAVARIAGILHMAKHSDLAEPWHVPIDMETTNSAVSIGTPYLIDHALAAFGQMGADPIVDYARYLLLKSSRWEQNRSPSGISLSVAGDVSKR